MPYKLLLADDSLTIQRVVELTFADEDIRVVAVADGQRAVERLQRDRPDIILADISMPRPDGYEVAAFARAQPGLSRVPILLLTGAFETIDEDRIAEIGVDGVLVKPFEPQLLITRVRELLGTASATVGREDAARQQEPTPSSEPPRTIAPAIAPRPTLMQSRPAPPTPTVPTAPTAHGDSGAARPSDDVGASLDDYFDRLDAAFASLGQKAGATEPPPPVARPTASTAPRDAPGLADHEWFDTAELSPSTAPVPDADLPLPGAEGPVAAEPAPAAVLDQAVPVRTDARDAEDEPIAPMRLIAQPPRVESRGTAAALPVPHAPVPAAPAPPVAVGPGRLAAPPPASPSAAAPAGVAAAPTPMASGTTPVAARSTGPTMADVFGALLAQEQGQSVAIPVRAEAVHDSVLEAIVERVLARLSETLTRDVVADIVSATAERLVREEIARLRGRA